MHIDQYERTWLMLVVAVLAIFFAALVAGAVVYGVRLPEPVGRVNPNMLQDTAFANPGLYYTGDTPEGRPHYDLYVLAQKWNFDAGSSESEGRHQIIRIPQGAEVTIYVTSRDITHGLIIEHHNVNFEVVPGEVAAITAVFNRPGEYGILCHEYCGIQHHAMWMKLIVEAPAEDAAASQ